MSILISTQNLSKSFGAQRIFHGISLGLFESEKLGLIGPNGTGKSTLLKILAELEDHDDGHVTKRLGLRLAYLPQVDSFGSAVSVLEALEQTLSGPVMDPTQIHVSVQTQMSLLGFADPNQKIETLSGGWRKRLALGCALIQEPDLVLLDEPTNHLDIDGILWLESVLKKAWFAFVVITHDRYFLQNVTNRILELSPRYPDGYLKTEGNYSDFLEKREAFVLEQQKKELTLSNIVRRETEWLRRGPKARTTKAKSRIEDAYGLQDELHHVKRRNRAERSADFDFESTENETKILVKAHNVSKCLGDKTLLQKFSLKLAPGMKLGLVGKNGCGKSTLMNLLAGQLVPDEGTVKYGLNVKVACFDQNRAQLNADDLVKHALSPSGSDTIIYRDKEVHIITWARRFLFQPEQLNSPVKSLSGGEQARILIARLMLEPADVLLLDEPTNDLDIPSLEVLEKTLLEFPGALILVTHDRYLLDRIATEILFLDGTGNSARYADLNQWLTEQNASKSEIKEKPPNPSAKSKPDPSQKNSEASPKKKLSYRDQFELDNIEKNILDAEAELDGLKSQIEDPELSTDRKKLTELCAKLAAAQSRVDALYTRWAELTEEKDSLMRAKDLDKLFDSGEADITPRLDLSKKFRPENSQ